MLQDILLTASSTNLSFKHGAAALNALCAFLEKCSISSEDRVRHFSYEAEIWTRSFNIYLTKSDNSKPKPLRRLLLILTHLISKRPTGTEKDLLLGNSICIATRAIRKQDDFADIKPAIKVLEHFLGTGLVGAAEIAQIKRPEDLGLFRTESMKMNSRIPDIEKVKVDQAVQSFALNVLEWMQYPDCAPAVGRFLYMFFKSLEESQSEDAIAPLKDGVLPLWISPIKQILEFRQELREVLEIHVLPGLLRLGPANVKALFGTLSLENIQQGNLVSSSISDIQLCLLVARISAEDSSLGGYLGQGQNTLPDLDNLGTSLLAHSSSSVRIAALSLLVSSSASTRPFRKGILRRLRLCIRYFHVEVNAKPRNEFIALMKKLCMRLRGATSSLLRCGQDRETLTKEHISIAAQSVDTTDAEDSAGSGGIVKQTLDKESNILQEHLAFRRWYMVFLLQELRPTASYQSHITALKVLDVLMEQSIVARNTSSRSSNDYFAALNEHLPQGLFLRPLTELLSDPFDDVRQSAKRVFDIHFSMVSTPRRVDESDLKAESTELEAKHSNDTQNDHRKAGHSILSELKRAEARAGITGRADDADGLGRLYSLLFTTSGSSIKQNVWHQSRCLIVDHIISTLENSVNVAKHDLLFAVSNIPLHGHMIALR